MRSHACHPPVLLSSSVIWAVPRSLAVGKANCLCSSSRFPRLGLTVLLFPVAAHLVQEGIPLS